MSDKLTEQKIEEMIKELLQEEQERLDEFNVKITKKWTTDKKNIGLTSLGQLGASSGTAASQILADLAALDGGAKDLEDADFQKASDDQATKPKNWKYVQNIVGTSTDANIKSWKAGGGGGGGYSALAASHGLGKGSNYGDWHTVIKTLWSAGNKTDAQTIFDEFVDIKYTKTGKSIPTGSTSVYQKVKKLLGTSPGPGGADLLDQLLMDLDSAKEYEPQTIARPVMTTQTVMRGSGYAGALNSTFSGLFKNADTMRKRLARIQEVSKAFVKGTNLNTTGTTSVFGNSTETLNAIVAMDWISAMVKEMDKGSSAYVFEAFCSMIAGGGGIGGSNKAGDFTIWNSKGLTDEGSAKYLKSKTGSSQAVSGFTKGDPVLYVQAHKRGKTTSGGLKNTSDPDAIQQIDLYVYEVEFSKIDQTNATNNSATVTTGGAGTVTHTFKADKSGNTRIHFTVQSPDFTIFIASASNIKSFKASLENKLPSGTQSQVDSYKLMKDYFAETYKADTQLKKYLGQGSKTINAATLQHGTDALAASLKADSKLESLFNELRGSSGGVTGTGTSRKVTESKLQSLDQLIAETMRDIKRKIKK